MCGPDMLLEDTHMTHLYQYICAAEDLWTWMALLCGNHLGSLLPFG